MDKEPGAADIRQLQFEVAHHCNLKCKGCAHFSPLSQKRFGDLKSFTRDLKRIHEFIGDIGEFRLLGGEPLLNDELCQFVRTARKIYPNVPVTVVTNGIRLAALDDRLRTAMLETNAAFSVSLYPPVRRFVLSEIEKKKKEGIRFREIRETDIFIANMDIEGDSDMETAEKQCPVSHCAVFEEGRLFKCPKALRINVYAEYYSLKDLFPACSIDLYARDLNREKLINYLGNPVDLCRFCGKMRPYRWQHAGKDPQKEDWYGYGPAGRKSDEFMES